MRAFPDNFAPSLEVVNVVVVAVPTEEAAERPRRERERLLPRPAEIRQVVCENCLERSEPSPPIPPEVQAMDVASALITADGHEEHRLVRWRVYKQWRQREDALKAWGRIEGDFRQRHQLCDPNAELHPPEPMPPFDPATSPPSWWSGPASVRDGWPAMPDPDVPGRFR